MNMAQMSQHLQNQYHNSLQNMNANMDSNQNQESMTPAGSNSSFITIIFQTSNSNSNVPLKIQCSKSDKISDVIDRYRTKSQDNDKTKKFIFNARELDQNLTVEQAGLYEGSNIFVVTTYGVEGA